MSATLPTTTGMNPLLAAYIQSLAKRPLTTKMVTGGILSFIQEILASRLAQLPSSPLPRQASSLPPPVVSLLRLLAQVHIGPKALKLALYGFLVSAPLGHYMVVAVTKAFAGKTGLGARLGQIALGNLVLAPIQVSAYLASMAIINGAASSTAVLNSVKANLFAAMKVTWMTSPASMVLAQRFLAPELWAPFFNLVNFCLGTYLSYHIKKAAMARAKGKGKPDITPGPTPDTTELQEKKEL